MYRCSDCGNLYKMSTDNTKLICTESPVEHIIKCPHCDSESHVIGADIDYFMDFMDGLEKKRCYMMYGRDKKPTDLNLLIVKGIKA